MVTPGPKPLGHIVWVATAALLVAACGVDNQREGTQPAPAVTTVEQGRFDDLPLFPRSDPVGSRNEKEGVVSRSFVAKGATAEQVMQFYERELEGWRLVEPPQRAGTTTLRAKWAQGNWYLQVSTAAHPPAVDDPAEAQVQYSLVLSPR